MEGREEKMKRKKRKRVEGRKGLGVIMDDKRGRRAEGRGEKDLGERSEEEKGKREGNR